jgi:GNAT superfamily N-acetyltransferase
MNQGHSVEARMAPATEEHLPAISHVASIIWRACYPGIISIGQIEYMLARMYSLETLRDEIASQAIRYDRLLVGDQLIGFAAYGPTATAGTFKLHKLYLHQDWHGRGLGTRLLKHCESEARKLGAHRLILNVNKRNIKAINAYRRNGFATSGTVVTDIGGGFVMDDYVMAKSLA